MKNKIRTGLLLATGLLLIVAAGFSPLRAAATQAVSRSAVDSESMQVDDMPWVQAKLTASDGTEYDELGHAVAMSGDGTTVVVGAYTQDAGGSKRGAAYVYTLPPGGWVDAVQVAKLTAGDGADGDELGTSVAVSMDGGTIAIGAPYNAGGGGWRGAAYVYTRPPGGWVDAAHTAKLTASGGADGDWLGTGVAVSGDGNMVVVGATGHDAGGSDRGAVYVYVRSPSGWADGTQTAKLTASDGLDYDYFGQAVAANGDGGILVAGAYQHGAGGIERGAAYVYVRPPSGWADGTQTAKLTASDGADGDNLGKVVAVSADGGTVVAGADRHDAGGSYRGAAYVYTQLPGGWVDGTQTAKLTAGNSVDNEFLGSSVAVSADGSVAAAGAEGYNGVGANQGAVFVYTQPPGGWVDGTHTARLTASDGTAQDDLGAALGMSWDGSAVVAGAPRQDVGDSNRGAAYVYTSVLLDHRVYLSLLLRDFP